MIYDRIDLKASGSWAKNFRPNGLVLSFGSNLAGGDTYSHDTSIPGAAISGLTTNVILPYGTVITLLRREQQNVYNYTVNNKALPYTAAGYKLSGAIATAAGVTFPTGFVFSKKIMPQGVPDPGGLTMPNGTIVSGSLASTAWTGSKILSTTELAFGSVVAGGVKIALPYSACVYRIPYGTKFTKALLIGSTTYKIGTLQPPVSEQFTMELVQLIDITGKAVFSFHGIKNNELIAFNRPAADIARLVMYRSGVGIACDPFACYSITFKTNVTAADIQAFNSTHTSDIQPIIVDDGSVKNPDFIIPA